MHTHISVASQVLSVIAQQILTIQEACKMNNTHIYGYIGLSISIYLSL